MIRVTTHFVTTLVTLAAACGSVDKKPANSSSNAATNVAANSSSNNNGGNIVVINNAASANSSNVAPGGTCARDTDCVAGQVCGADDECITASCDFCTEAQVCYRPTPDSPGSCSAPTTMASCDSRVDCGSSQECRDGACISHQPCFADGGPNGAGCEYDWSCEDDDKVYAMACELLDDGLTVVCECLINDVGTTSFEGEVESTCEYESAHRAANDNCGFLVPRY